MITQFSGQFEFLSNFFPVTINYNDLIYPSAEHAYQAAKSTNPRVQAAFTRVHRAADVKTLGGEIRCREDWDSVRLSTMEEILRIKFKGPTMSTRLLKTGEVELVEGNWWGDTFWGVCRGEGENHLGKLLMKIREELRSGV